MPNTTTALTAAGETYFADLGRVRASGGATGERSSYGPLANLLNAVGATLAPKVFCVGELADQGDTSVAEVRQRVAAAEGLTPEEVQELLPSGRQPVFTNRVSWALGVESGLIFRGVAALAVATSGDRTIYAG